MATRTIRIGIIGTGGMANAHADQYKKIPGVELVSGFDVLPGRAEAFVEKHGLKHAAKSLKDMFEQVDAVSVVTPDRFHFAPSMAALKAGKHLLCEKPLCPTLAEAKKLAQTAKASAKKGVVAMVNFSYRSSAAFQEAIKVVRKGELGPLRHVSSHYLQSWLSPKAGVLDSDAMLWRLKTAAGSGGVLGDLGCHILDLTTAVAGDTPKAGFIKRVRCTLKTFPKKTPKEKYVTKWKGEALDANDSAVIELEFAGGALGVVQATRWATGNSNHLRIEIAGADAALMFDLDRSYEQLDRCDIENAWAPKWVTQTLPKTPTNWERFIASIRSGKTDQPDLARGAQVQAYIDAAERSAKSGKWESVRAWI